MLEVPPPYSADVGKVSGRWESDAEKTGLQPGPEFVGPLCPLYLACRFENERRFRTGRCFKKRKYILCVWMEPLNLTSRFECLVFVRKLTFSSRAL